MNVQNCKYIRNTARATESSGIGAYEEISRVFLERFSAVMTGRDWKDCGIRCGHETKERSLACDSKQVGVGVRFAGEGRVRNGVTVTYVSIEQALC